jgi:predicted N-formylglutamate amidohydrolase
MSAALDAPLVAAGISRLVIDCNRPLDAPDLITAISETTLIPGNASVSAAEKARRVAEAHAPFHDAIDALVEQRLRTGAETWVVSVHSFTPVYKGRQRPWEIGIIHDDDTRIALPLIRALQQEPGLKVGVNEPYSPADRVYYTLERHARARGLPCAMIEIRNDEIASEAGQSVWAARLAAILSAIGEPSTVHETDATSNKKEDRIGA